MNTTWRELLSDEDVVGMGFGRIEDGLDGWKSYE